MSNLSRHRENFIEILFPIAISVGFAEHVASILLHKNYTRTPDHALLLAKLLQGSGYEIALLFVAMVAVVLSWNWYIPRLQTYPLDSVRFILDNIIVAMYLVLLVSSWLYDVWFWSLAIIWWLYLLWDLALDDYCKRNVLVRERSTKKIIMGSAWAILLTLLARFHHAFTFAGAIFAFFCALSTVIFYRIDQDRDWNWGLNVGLLSVPVAFWLLGAFC